MKNKNKEASLDLDVRDIHAIQNESQSETLRFRVTPSLKHSIEQSLKELGVKDFSAFVRGALLNAIELARLGEDPKWREFVATVNAGPARAILGHGLALSNARDVEGRGRVRSGLSAEELTRRLKRRVKETNRQEADHGRR